MFPKTGNKLHQRDKLICARVISAALREQLGQTHRAAKTLMRWTGASERSAKNWLSGFCAPSGSHLVILVRESDVVARAFLGLADRADLLSAIEVEAAKTSLLEALSHLDAAFGSYSRV